MLTHPALDYLSVRLELLSKLTKDMGSAIYEREHGVTLRELRVLRLAHHTAGITQGEVVLHSMLEKTLVSRMVTSLVRRGLLERQIGAHDARLFHLYLTDRGRQVVRQCNRIGHRLEKSLLAGLDPADVEVFERCLSQLTVRARQHMDRARDAG